MQARRSAAARVRLSDRSVQRDALPVLIELLMKEKDGQVRLAVFDAVTALGRDAAPAVPALLHTLRTDYGGQGKEETHQDYRAALALAAIGEPAVEGLRGLLGGRKESVRAEVAMGLGRIGPDAGAAVPDLILALGDKSERVRREASVALGRIGTIAVEPLIEAAGHQDSVVRAGAVQSLGHVSAPGEEVGRAVLAATRDAAPEVRAAAVRSLAGLGLPDEALLPALMENLRHEDEHVRLAVVNLLVGRRPLLARLAPEFESLLTAENPAVSGHAAFLLGMSGVDSAPRLLNALRHEESRVDQIADGLARIGRPAVGPLTLAIRDPEPRVRRGAALALGQIRPLAPGTVQTLATGLADPDVEVRAAFLTAIGQLGPRGEETVQAVRALLRDESAEIRSQSIEVLSRSAARDDRLLADFMAMLDDPDARVQRRAIDTLRSLGPPGRKALTTIVGKLDGPDLEVRLAAAEWIGSHGQAAAEAVPALIVLLDDPTPELRTVAALTLGKLGSAAQPAFDRLASLLAAGDAKARAAAALTLGSLELDAEAIRPHLSKALGDGDPEVRRAAVRAIGRLGPRGAIFLPDLIALAANREAFASIRGVLRRFERRGPDARSIPELVKQLEHDEEAVRLLAIKFLGLAGRGATDAIPALDRLREDPSAAVRKQAEAAKEQIKAGSAPGSDRGSQAGEG